MRVGSGVLPAGSPSRPSPSPVADEPNAAVTAGRRTLARVDCRRRGRGFPGHPGAGRGPSSPAACGVRARSRPSPRGRGPQRHLQLRRGRRCGRGGSGHPAAGGGRRHGGAASDNPASDVHQDQIHKEAF